MSKRTECTCDWCGTKFYPDSFGKTSAEVAVKKTIVDVETATKDSNYDVCPECVIKFDNFINSLKK